MLLLDRLRLLELLAAGALPLDRLRLELLAAGCDLLPEDERERVAEPPLLAVEGLLREDDLTRESLPLVPLDEPRTALLPLEERLRLVGL